MRLTTHDVLIDFAVAELAELDALSAINPGPASLECQQAHADLIAARETLATALAFYWAERRKSAILH